MRNREQTWHWVVTAALIVSVWLLVRMLSDTMTVVIELRERVERLEASP